MAITLLALRADHALPPQNIIWYSFMFESVRAMTWLKGLGKLKEISVLIDTRTCDLPVCGIEPQPSTLPRVPLPTGIAVKLRTTESSYYICYSYYPGLVVRVSGC
jgi:hypothetical protein